MKKIVSLVVLGALSVASAQSQQTLNSKYGPMNLIGCFADNGQTRCDFSIANVDGFDGTLSTVYFNYATSAGEVHQAKKIRLMNGTWSDYVPDNIKVMAGLPVKVSVMFDAKPSGVLPFIYSVDQKNRLTNIPIQNGSMPATVKTAPTAVTVQANGFTIDLSGCTKSGSDYKCNSATLKAK